MYVPNYVPEPIEVPENVTERPYLVRVAFVRRVSILHFLSLLVAGSLSYASLPFPNIWTSLAAYVAAIVVLSLIRIKLRSRRLEYQLSTALLPLLLLSLGSVGWNLRAWGLPIWSIFIGVGCACIYTVLCGRDFSFVGQYMLSLIVSSVVIASFAVSTSLPPRMSAIALSANVIYLSYWTYDSASLLARRRLGEELGAVVDLYRDVLNIFGYIPRVLGHWRRHKIWIAR